MTDDATAKQIEELVAEVAQLISGSGNEPAALLPYRRSLFDTTIDDFERVWVLYEPSQAEERIYMDANGELVRNGIYPDPIMADEIDDSATTAVLDRLRSIIPESAKRGWRQYLPWLP